MLRTFWYDSIPSAAEGLLNDLVGHGRRCEQSIVLFVHKRRRQALDHTSEKAEVAFVVPSVTVYLIRRQASCRHGSTRFPRIRAKPGQSRSSLGVNRAFPPINGFVALNPPFVTGFATSVAIRDIGQAKRP